MRHLRHRRARAAARDGDGRADDGALAHRGPDGDGIFADEGVALGHRRLAILDLSDAGPAVRERRRRPTAGPQRRDLQLPRAPRRARGARATASAARPTPRCVLAAYREWGDSCVERFNGMWAFALWDAHARRLFCSRDRFGVKPFHYRWDGSRFVFASEPKAFRADPSITCDPTSEPFATSSSRVRSTTATRRSSRASTTLPPAHTLVIDQPALRLARYWHLEPRDRRAADSSHAVRELFLDSVRLRLRSDVPVGTALSGGLDSSAIAGAIDHLLRTEHDAADAVGPRQQTFTAYFEDAGFDERPYAEAVVAKTGAEAHWISFTDVELVDVLPLVVEAQGEPFGSTSVVAQWHVMRAARSAGVTVMLDGQGGDEVLAGYPTTFPYLLADLLASGRLGDATREIKAHRRVQGGSGRSIAQAIVTPLPAPGCALAPAGPSRRRACARRPLASRHRPHTRASGHHEPARSAAAAVRVDPARARAARAPALRGPQLDGALDRGARSVPRLPDRRIDVWPARCRSRQATGSRSACCAARSQTFCRPSCARGRDKLGFVTPEARFFRGSLGEMAADVFSSRAFRERGLVNAETARRQLAAHRSGVTTAGFELWRALERRAVGAGLHRPVNVSTDSRTSPAAASATRRTSTRRPSGPCVRASRSDRRPPPGSTARASSLRSPTWRERP